MGESISTRVVISKVLHLPGLGVKVLWGIFRLELEDGRGCETEFATIRGVLKVPRAAFRIVLRTGVMKKISGLIKETVGV